MSENIEPRKKTAKRDDIIRQAFHVFYREGFHATAIETVLIGTGISKRTLYKYFPTKEDLVAASITYYSKLMSEQTSIQLSETIGSAEDKILAIFDLQAAFLGATDFCGCYAINAKLEYANKNGKIEDACTSFFDGILGGFEELLRVNNYKSPKDLAGQLLLLLQGAIINAQTKKETSPFTLAKSAAKLLLATK